MFKFLKLWICSYLCWYCSNAQLLKKKSNPWVQPNSSGLSWIIFKLTMVSWIEKTPQARHNLIHAQPQYWYALTSLHMLRCVCSKIFFFFFIVYLFILMLKSFIHLIQMFTLSSMRFMCCQSPKDLCWLFWSIYFFFDWINLFA